MSKIFCYNSNMPAYFEKKEAALAAKIEPSIKRQLESIADDMDQMSAAVRTLDDEIQDTEGVQ